jgi:hypothetical protein
MGLQTEQDVLNEDLAAASVEEYYRVKLVTLADYDHVDRYAVRDKRIVALFEIKTRDKSYKQYNSMFFALRKWEDMFHTSLTFRVPGFLIAQWEDFLGAVNIFDACTPLQGATWPVPLVMGGRRDRGFANDYEPMICVPWEKFEEIPRLKVMI